MPCVRWPYIVYAMLIVCDAYLTTPFDLISILLITIRFLPFLVVPLLLESSIIIGVTTIWWHSMILCNVAEEVTFEDVVVIHRMIFTWTSVLVVNSLGFRTLNMLVSPLRNVVAIILIMETIFIIIFFMLCILGKVGNVFVAINTTGMVTPRLPSIIGVDL